MSDQKSSYGEPVEESANVDDVVGRAHEGLADAEAARRDAVATEAAAAEPAVVTPGDDRELDPIYAEHADDAPAASSEPAVHTDHAAAVPREPVVAESVVESETRVAEPETRAAEPVSADEPVSPTQPASAHERAYPDEPAYPAEPAYPVEPAYPAEPAYPVRDETVVVASAAAAQPIFVQAPEQPRPRGNRGAAGAIGLLAAVAFALLYLGAWLGIGAIEGDVSLDNVGQKALAALTTWSLWVPVVVFFVGFWLLGGIINRGRWGLWVVLGLFVGLAAYAGHILGALFQAPFWELTARQGVQTIEQQLFAPLAIVAFVVGRELTIWFGAWVAARGRRMTEINIEAQREYERTLEAGPQLVRP